MKKYQGDHGWPTKITPDSRALIKLGLGPSNPSALQTANQSPAPHATVSDAPANSAANTLATAHAISN